MSGQSPDGGRALWTGAGADPSSDPPQFLLFSQAITHEDVVFLVSGDHMFLGGIDPKGKRSIGDGTAPSTQRSGLCVSPEARQRHNNSSLRRSQLWGHRSDLETILQTHTGPSEGLLLGQRL